MFQVRLTSPSLLVFSTVLVSVCISRLFWVVIVSTSALDCTPH